jgi:uncharacterized membrane protein YdjX (TVP38/TMEM64 family)
MKLSRDKIWLLIRIIFICILFCIIFFVVSRHFHNILHLLRKKDIQALAEYIRNKGKNGVAVLVFLQILETVTVILPSMPVYVTAGLIFGGLNGFIICYLTNLILNFLIFLFGQKIDRKTQEIFNRPNHERMKERIAASSRPYRIVILMCNIPVVPKGMIPYICANGKMKLQDFMKGLSIGSFPSILLYAFFGDAVLTLNRQLLPYLAGIFILMILLMTVFREQLSSYFENKLN